jgi:hypothetical protein
MHGQQNVKVSKTIALSYTRRIKLASMMGKKGRFEAGLKRRSYNKNIFYNIYHYPTFCILHEKAWVYIYCYKHKTHIRV